MNNLGARCASDAVLLRALDEELPPRQAWLLKLHLESCESCQARFDGLRQISSRVAELHQVAVPADSTERFAARLEAEELRRRNSGWRRWLARPLWQQLAWCGAFALAILAGFRARTLRPTTPVRRIIVQPLPGSVLPPAPKQLAAVRVPAQPVRPVRRRVKKHAPQPPVSAEAVAGTREVVTPFITLPFSDAALPLDQAAVIRVELPRSALELAGLPVNEDRRSERVRADLVLGADGLARAIRFVQ